MGWYEDFDTDGYGNPTVAMDSCTQPSGYVSNSDDCNDTEELAWTGATEVCDGVDNNCSGDESDATDILTWYADTDADTYGDSANSVLDCNQPSGFVADSSDCDDNEGSLTPADMDLDGFSTCDGDCDDTDDLAYPGAAYNDSATECLRDADGDGYGGGEVCYTVSLWDTRIYWEPGYASLKVLVNGVEDGSYTNLGGDWEYYDHCLIDASGATVSFVYECTSTYDCPNQGFIISNEVFGDTLYEDGQMFDGSAPSQGTVYSEVVNSTGTDCDDNDNFIYPGAPEEYNDGIDQDCDGSDLVSLPSCLDLANAGAASDGVFTLTRVDGLSYNAYCDMTTDGGGWTRIVGTDTYNHSQGQTTTDIVTSYVSASDTVGVADAFANLQNFTQVMIKKTSGTYAGEYAAYDLVDDVSGQSV